MAEPVYEFDAQHKVGSRLERELAALYGVAPAAGLGSRDAGDLLVETPSGLLSVEAKLDERYDKSGNIAIELADNYATRPVATGVAKSTHLWIPTVYVHQLGKHGNSYLLYCPVTAYQHIAAANRGGFHRVVSVHNKGFKTANGIAKPAALPFVLQVPRMHLRAAIDQWQPTILAAPIPPEQIAATVIRVAAAHRNPDVPQNLTVKGDPADHNNLRQRIMESRGYALL